MAEPWLQLWTDTVPLLKQQTFPRLLLSVLLGGLIGAERQYRQRAAGLRTNTLVCLGAAAFADLGCTLAGPNSTGVIAYVVSGVGFLGAGAIIKDGASIRGLNTAATLWCSAAVGACAGAGEMLDAAFIAVLLVGVNLALRPIARFIDRRAATLDTNVTYRFRTVCEAKDEIRVRGVLLQAIAERDFILKNLRMEDIEDTEEMAIIAELEAHHRDDDGIHAIVATLRGESLINTVEWAEAPADSE